MDYWRLNIKSKKKNKTGSKRKPNHTYIVKKPTIDCEKYLLGHFTVGTTNNILPNDWIKCQVQIDALESIDVLKIAFDDAFTVVITLLLDAPFVIDLLSTNLFTYNFIQNNDNVLFQLYLSGHEKYVAKKAHNTIKDVFKIIYNISDHCYNLNGIKNNNCHIEDMSETYRIVRENHKIENIPKIDVQSEHIIPVLRQYQKDAVQWMIHRETETDNKDILHPSYCPIKLPSGIEIYYDKYSGFITYTKPMIKTLRTGGILADEMGLGKTVEVLTCILMNPKIESSDNKMDVEENETHLNCTLISGRNVLIDSSSDSDDSDTPLNVIAKTKIIAADDLKPTVYPTPKTRKERKRKIKSQSNDSPYIDKPLKVRADWVKKPKTEIRVALEMWYQSTLKSVNDKEAEVVDSKVKCICGETNERGIVACVDCELNQHIACMGYEKKFGVYRCPQCWMKQPLIESKATLIVSPLSIKGQWIEEICKHVNKDLKILQYNTKEDLIYPASLINYDIVITTYTTLQSELRVSDNIESKSLRRQSKYLVKGSPIALINWWRLCLDEAQTVESSKSMVSEMAKKLSAHHRWAVTGTPISKGLSDLYGLIDYLQFEPYCDADTWHNLLYKPFANGYKDAMHNLLSQILWRTVKNDVLDQINIPKQSIEMHMLEFTPVEKYFYDREHEMSSFDFIQKLKKYDLSLPLVQLTKSELKKILQPIITLRRACLHHNAVRGRYLVTKKPVNSMEELLQALIGKIITECEDELRAIISSLNGLAGIYILLNKPQKAIDEYRKVLQIVSKFQDDKATGLKLIVDHLQLIHSMYNLAEILQLHPPKDKTLRDDKLNEEVMDLEKKYIEKFNKQTTNALEDLTNTSNEILEDQNKLILGWGKWYVNLLEYVTMNDLSTELKTRLQNFFESNSYLRTPTFTNESRILYVIKKWDDEINALREDTMMDVNDLYNIIEGKINIHRKIVLAATDCHLRPTNKTKTKHLCAICLANTKLKQYESKLFYMTTKKNNDDQSNEGCWKPSTEEQVMKVIHHLGKLKNADSDALEDGENYLHVLELYKKEFKELRKLWTYLDAQTSAGDEVEICKIRLQLKNEETPKNKNIALKNLSYTNDNRLESINQLELHELDYQLAMITNEVATNSAQLEKCLGTHKYLQTLHQQQNSGATPDPCPICKNTLDTRWNILRCGHCYCLECIQVLLGAQGNSKFIQCSICREKQNVEEINFIEKSIKIEVEYEDDVKIKGNYSTKMEAIIKLVIKLKSEDPDIKILVFSTWPILLKLLKDVFVNNGVTSEILSHNNLQKTLNLFKNPKMGITALLLPINLGAKGLNLIEATHVIFMEPLLDPADELQAIGRVHRIGQTKPTIVHKFLLQNTIEESIYSATSTKRDVWDKNKVTLSQLKDLFSSNLEIIPIIDEVAESAINSDCNESVNEEERMDLV